MLKITKYRLDFLFIRKISHMKILSWPISIMLMVLIGGSIVSNPLKAQGNVDQQLRNILNEQAKAWNNGDINTFMETYWRSDDLQFLGSSGLTSGWDNTLLRYQRRYPDKQAMGHLTFDVVSVNKRSGKVYSLVGKFHLERDGLENLEGYFLLIWQKIRGEWRIVADSTH